MVFAAALEKSSPAERAAYLDEACSGDAALRQRVEALLDSHTGAGGFLEMPAIQRAVENLEGEACPEDTQAEQPGDDDGNSLDFLAPSRRPDSLGRLGHYEVLESIGRGGMGVVLRAFDDKLHRVVAIKVMAPQLATNATARKRFVREAQAAAAIRNEHVIDIHAVEEANGLPYLAMEYIAGISLQERPDRSGPLELKEILRIGMQTAAGLAAAHAQGLIHRDVKPSNILLENGVERVRLTDFGLARAADDASLSQSGVVAGTPQYMAPEQAAGEPVDHRSDLFSLGSVLYAMCTGRAPFRASTTMAVLKRVCEDTPGPIRESNPEVPDWLAGIVAKLHAKNAADRFQSAAEVADLLGQQLAHLQQPSLTPMPRAPDEPAAPRAQRGTRGRRWATAAVILLVIATGLGVTEATGVTKVAQLVATVLRIRIPEGTLVVEVSDPQVKVTIEGDGGLVITGAGPQEVRLAPGQYQLRATKDGKQVHSELVTISRGDKQVVKVSLEAASPVAATPQVPPLAPGEIRRFVPYWGQVVRVAVSPDGKRALFGGEDTVVWLVDLSGKAKPRAFEGHTKGVLSVAFSPDGRCALSGGTDATVRLWDVESGKELRQFGGHNEAVWSVAFSPDGHRAVSGDGGQFKDGRWVWPENSGVSVWDLETGKELHRFTGHAGSVRSVAFTPDGRHVLVGGHPDPVVRLLNVETGKGLRRFEGHLMSVHHVAFSRTGNRVLTASSDRTLRLWDAETGKLLRRFLGHTSDVSGVAFSPDDRYCASCSWDRTVRLWDLETGKELHRFEGHTCSIWDVAFTPDGRNVLSGAEDGTVRLWRVPEGLLGHGEIRRFDAHTGAIWSVALTPDGRYALSSGGLDNTLHLWEVQTGKEVRRFKGHTAHVRCVAISPDGHRALSGTADLAMRLWDLDSGKELHRFLGQGDLVCGVCFSPDGRHILSGGMDGVMWLWDVEGVKETRQFKRH